VRSLRDAIAVTSLGTHGDSRTLHEQIEALDKEL
jgi:hypothetical protein